MRPESRMLRFAKQSERDEDAWGVPRQDPPAAKVLGGVLVLAEAPEVATGTFGVTVSE